MIRRSKRIYIGIFYNQIILKDSVISFFPNQTTERFSTPLWITLLLE